MNNIDADNDSDNDNDDDEKRSVSVYEPLRIEKLVLSDFLKFGANFGHVLMW